MLYTLVLRDAANGAEARKQHHEAHVAHFRAHKDKLALSGPLMDEDSNGAGSLVIMEADSEADVRTFIEADPFFDAGVWEDVFISKLKVSILDPSKLQ